MKKSGAKVPKPEMEHINYVLAILKCVERSKLFVKEQDAVGLEKELNIARKNGFFEDEDYKGRRKTHFLNWLKPRFSRI